MTGASAHQTGPLRRFLAASRLFYSQALSVELIYRFALGQSFVGAAIGFVGLICFWIAAARNQSGTMTYSMGALIAYFVFASMHGMLHENKLSWNLSSGIRMGKLSASMLRPYPYLWSLIGQTAAQATIRMLILMPILMVLFYTVAPFADAIHAITWSRLGLYIGALALSLLVGWLAKMGIGLLAFDMTQTWGPELIFLSLFSAASGISYPVDLLPAIFATIASWTPVYYMIGFPTLVLLGRLDDQTLLQGLIRGSVVTAATALLVWLMWRRGMKSFEAIGI